MAYDHSDKIGNQGDLVKHYGLYLCLKTLLEKHPSDKPFVYAESHAGRAEYVLPRGGWKSGIGAFSKFVRTGPAGAAPSGLGEFDEIFIGRKLKAGMKYFGSTGIAFRVLRGGAEPLRQPGQPFIMKLWEQSLPAVEDLTRYYHPWMQPHLGSNSLPTQLVEINHGDGFAGVQTAGDLSFVLIDPPSISDAEKVFTLIAYLKEQETPYLCWMPRISYLNAESQESVEFGKKAAGNGRVCHGVQWALWTEAFCGCWLAGSQNLAREIKIACDEISGLMHWFP